MSAASAALLSQGAGPEVPRSIHEGAGDMTRDIAQTDAYCSSRRQRKKVEMLFAHRRRVRADAAVQRLELGQRGQPLGRGHVHRGHPQQRRLMAQVVLTRAVSFADDFAGARACDRATAARARRPQEWVPHRHDHLRDRRVRRRLPRRAPARRPSRRGIASRSSTRTRPTPRSPISSITFLGKRT